MEVLRLVTEIAEVHEVLPASPLAPALARQLLDGWMSDMVGEATADDVRSIATEIIGNAVRHGNLGEADKIVLSGTVDDTRDVVRIEIEQPTRLTGALGHSKPDPEAFGMGLRIVDGLATQWGLDEGPPGVVWFEVDR
jgi:anti-sigma regulatory factor (Ser/Thr protein kinase)